jgi:voltage-gated potassium channel
LKIAHFIITTILMGLILCGPLVPPYALHLLFLSAVFVTAILLSGGTPRIRRVVTLLGGLVVISLITLELLAEHGMHGLLKMAFFAQLVAVLAFLIYCVIASVSLLLKMRLVSTNEICATVNLYLILGIAWAYGYMLLETCDPDAFTPQAAGRTVGLQMLYFSFVTLTTLGYGDVTACSDIARMLTVTEAIIGNLYVAVVVTYLLSVHIDQRMNR